MENIATSVRIAGDATRVLAKLATKLGRSKAHVIEVALKELEERIFWGEVEEAFRRTAENPKATAHARAEFALWEQSTANDMKNEEW